MGGESSFGAEGPSMRGLLLRNRARDSIEISGLQALFSEMQIFRTIELNPF
jgi:hypothetical protein